jgi:hypothetical protein
MQLAYSDSYAIGIFEEYAYNDFNYYNDESFGYFTARDRTVVIDLRGTDGYYYEIWVDESKVYHNYDHLDAYLDMLVIY